MLNLVQFSTLLSWYWFPKLTNCIYVYFIPPSVMLYKSSYYFIPSHFVFTNGWVNNDLFTLHPSLLFCFYSCSLNFFKRRVSVLNISGFCDNICHEHSTWCSVTMEKISLFVLQLLVTSERLRERECVCVFVCVCVCVCINPHINLS